MSKGKFIKGTKGNDQLIGSSKNDFIVSGKGNDEINAGAGHDIILSGKGNDVVNGGAGHDLIIAGKGNDIVTGGSGDDCIHLGKGNDTAIYVVGDNVDNEDFYHGGRGHDTLRLEFTKEEWLRPDIQADIAAYLAYLSGNTVPDGYWYNRSTFEFKAFNLTAKQFENLEVVVDGKLLNPADELVDAVDDVVTVSENSTITGNVLDNDDVPDLVKSVELIDDVTKGSLIFNPDGTFSYDTNDEFEELAVGETVTQTFTYKVIDADGDEDIATAIITITGENDAPVASMIDAGITNEDALTVMIDLLSTASDPDTSDDLDTDSVMVSSSNVGRTVLFLIDNETGVFSLEPSQFNELAVGESEMLTISYNVIDGNGGVTPNTATLLVEGRNDAPIITVTNPDPVLEGNFDRFNQTATDIQTVDVFAHTNIDDPDTSDTQNFVQGSISILADSASATMDLGLLTIDQTTGEVSYDRNKFNFLDDGESAIYNVTYQVKSGPETFTETLVITILGENDAPFVRRPLLDPIDEDTPLIITKADLLSSTVEFDLNDQGNLELVDVELNGASAPYGSLVDNGDDTWTFTPSENFFTDQISSNFHIRVNFKVSDGTAISDPSDAQFRILPVNDDPVANDDGFAIDADQVLTVAANGVLANDTDVDATDILTVSNFQVTSALGAVVTVNADGSLNYDATGVAAIQALGQGVEQEDTFTYTISDGNGGTDTATVTVTVTGVNDAPEAVMDGATVDEDGTVLIDVLDNDSDVNGDALTISDVTTPTNGMAVIENGQIRYTPNGNFSGIDTFSYTIDDGRGGMDTATVTVNIHEIADEPSLTAEVVGRVGVDAAAPLNIMAAVTDLDGSETITQIKVTGLPAGASLNKGVVSEIDGSVLLNPSEFDGDLDGLQILVENQNVTDFTLTIEATVTDTNPETGDTDTTTKTIMVDVDVNEAPVAQDDFVSVNEDSSVLIDVLNGDTDGEGDDLELTLINSGPSNGTAEIQNGQVLYIPNENFSGQDSFTYLVKDEFGGASIGTVTVYVTPDADAPTLKVSAPEAMAGMTFFDEFTVNEEVTNNQFNPQVTELSDGRVLFTWRSLDVDVDGSGFGISGRIGSVQADGSIAWEMAGEFTVNEEVTNGQFYSQVTELSDGRVLFTWHSEDSDVDGHLSGISGRIGTVQEDGSIVWEAAGEFTVNEEIAGFQFLPQMTELSDGRVLFTWSSADLDVDGSGFGISGRIGSVQADGSIAWEMAGEFTVNEEVTSTQELPQVIELSDGRVLFTWNSFDADVDGNLSGISARIGTVQADGSIAWESTGEFTVNEEVTNGQVTPLVIELSDERVLFTWISEDPDVDGSGFGVSGRIGTVKADGSIIWAAAGEITVNEEIENSQFSPQVTELNDGRLLFTWSSSDPDVDGNNSGISGRIGTVQSDGNIAWDVVGEFTVNDEVENFQFSPQVTELNNGRLLFTWASRDPDVDVDGAGISARILELNNGSPEDTPIEINILTELFDTDGSETLSLTLSGFPAGATFSLGSLQGTDWVIADPADIASLNSNPLVMTPPLNYNGSFDLAVTATVTDSATLTTGVVTDTASVTQTHTLTIAPVNDAPEINGWDAQLTGKFGVIGPQIIDANATISDPELDLLNGGLGNYDGASLTLNVQGGVPNAILGYLGTTLTQGLALSVGGVDVGVVTEVTNLSATIQFNDNATSAIVDQVTQSLTYAPASQGFPTVPQSITLTFDDGNTGLQGSGGAVASSDNGVAIQHIPVTTSGLFGKQLLLGSSLITVNNGTEFNITAPGFGTLVIGDIGNDSVFVDVVGSVRINPFSFSFHEVNNDFTDIIGVQITDGAPGWSVSFTSSSFTVHIADNTQFNPNDDFAFKLIFAPTDPLVLDLGPGGVHFTPLETAVSFDINADGIVDQTAWTNGEDGLLVIDLDGSGAIEDGSELFSPIFGDDDFADSVEALASLDSNGDGKIDEVDDQFSDILVWQDLNSDGVSQDGELKSLAEHNIASIDLNAFESDLIIDDQSIISTGGYSLTDGTVKDYVAVDFNHIEGGVTTIPDDNPSDSGNVVVIDDFIIA